MKITDIQNLVKLACKEQGEYISLSIEISRPGYSDNNGIDISVWHGGDSENTHFPTIESAVNHLRLLAGNPVTNNEEIVDG